MATKRSPGSSTTSASPESAHSLRVPRGSASRRLNGMVLMAMELYALNNEKQVRGTAGRLLRSGGRPVEPTGPRRQADADAAVADPDGLAGAEVVYQERAVPELFQERGGEARVAAERDGDFGRFRGVVEDHQ